MQTRTPVSPTRPGDLESAACASHGTGGQTDELTPVHDAFSRLYPNRSLAYTPVVTVMSLLAVKSVSTQGDTLSNPICRLTLHQTDRGLLIGRHRFDVVQLHVPLQLNQTAPPSIGPREDVRVRGCVSTRADDLSHPQ